MRSERWLVLSDGARPTEDIYFLESAAPLLRAWEIDAGRLDVRGWRGFLAKKLMRRMWGVNLIICRSLPMLWIAWLQAHREQFGRVVYLIDDDIEAAANDVKLPEHYRRRMAGIARCQPDLLALCDEVVACSEKLAERFRARHGAVSVLTPPLIAALPYQTHLEQPPSSQTPWRIGFYGTRAHLGDLEHIAPGLENIQQQREDTALEVMLGQYTPKALRELPGVATPEPLPWPAFRRYQASHQVHIGLAPLLDSPFNQGKSFIKFLDIAAMGGVGIYSKRYPYTEIVRHAENGLLVEDDPVAWQAAIEELLDNPVATAEMARTAAADARRLGDPDHAADFWQRLGRK
ncbi:glycosyltransferase family 1 protein [Halomonas sp. CH40]